MLHRKPVENTSFYAGFTILMCETGHFYRLFRHSMAPNGLRTRTNVVTRNFDCRFFIADCPDCWWLTVPPLSNPVPSTHPRISSARRTKTLTSKRVVH